MTGSIGAAALGLYGLAARLLGWRPDEFWAATPTELGAAMASPGQPANLGRADLDRMMEQDHAKIRE